MSRPFFELSFPDGVWHGIYDFNKYFGKKYTKFCNYNFYD